MTVQDNDSLAVLSGQLLQTPGQVQFFGSEQLQAKSAELTKRPRLAKNERTGQRPGAAANRIPYAGQRPRPHSGCIQTDRAAARQTSSTLNRRDDIREEFRPWIRIGSEEKKPGAAGRCGARVPRAGKLVDGCKHHTSSGGPRQ